MCLLGECDRNDRFVCVVCVNVLHFISIRAVLVAVTSELRIAPQNVRDVLFGPNEYVAVRECYCVYLMDHTEESFEPCQHNCCALEE